GGDGGREVLFYGHSALSGESLQPRRYMAVGSASLAVVPNCQGEFTECMQWIGMPHEIWQAREKLLRVLRALRVQKGFADLSSVTSFTRDQHNVDSAVFGCSCTHVQCFGCNRAAELCGSLQRTALAVHWTFPRRPHCGHWRNS